MLKMYTLVTLSGALDQSAHQNRAWASYIIHNHCLLFRQFVSNRLMDGHVGMHLTNAHPAQTDTETPWPLDRWHHQLFTYKNMDGWQLWRQVVSLLDKWMGDPVLYLCTLISSTLPLLWCSLCIFLFISSSFSFFSSLSCIILDWSVELSSQSQSGVTNSPIKEMQQQNTSLL